MFSAQLVFFLYKDTIFCRQLRTMPGQILASSSEEKIDHFHRQKLNLFCSLNISLKKNHEPDNHPRPSSAAAMSHAARFGRHADLLMMSMQLDNLRASLIVAFRQKT